MKNERQGIKSVITAAIFVFFTLFLASPSAYAGFFPDLSSPDSRGLADCVEDMAYVIRSDKRHKLTEGFELLECDTIWTGTTGTATLRLLDNTEIELGPESTVHLMKVVFKPDEAALKLNIDSGCVRIKTGSIGLKDPEGIKIVTPKNHIAVSNGVISLTEKRDEEIIQVEWMSQGSVIEVYNPASKQSVEITETGTVLLTNRAGEMCAGNVEDAL